MPTAQELDILSVELATLMEDAQAIYAAAGQPGQVYAGWPESLAKKIREWLDKAFGVASKVHGDSVQISAGIPMGFSVGVSFSVTQQENLGRYRLEGS